MDRWANMSNQLAIPGGGFPHRINHLHAPQPARELLRRPSTVALLNPERIEIIQPRVGPIPRGLPWVRARPDIYPERVEANRAAINRKTTLRVQSYNYDKTGLISRPLGSFVTLLFILPANIAQTSAPPRLPHSAFAFCSLFSFPPPRACLITFPWPIQLTRPLRPPTANRRPAALVSPATFPSPPGPSPFWSSSSSA